MDSFNNKVVRASINAKIHKESQPFTSNYKAIFRATDQYEKVKDEYGDKHNAQIFEFIEIVFGHKDEYVIPA